MKDSGIEWIGQIPCDWQVIKLKNLSKSHFGGCWGEEPKNNENDALCVRIADFDFQRQTIKDTANTFRNYSNSQLEKGILENDDLIIEKSGGGEKTPVGRVVIFNNKKFTQKTMFANFSECLRLKNNIIARYIAYHLKTLYYSFDMRYFINQTIGIQNLNLKEYYNTYLCLPNTLTQTKIADYLDNKCEKIDRLIDIESQAIEKLKEYKQSIITEVVTRGLDKSVPLKDSGIEWIGQIPCDWELIRLKDICKYKKEVVGDRFANYDRVALTLNGVIKRPKDDANGLQPKEFKDYQIIEKNDFIFKMIDLQNISTSRVGLSQYTGIVSPAYIRFVPKTNKQFNNFTYYYLMSLYYNCVYNNLAGDGVRSALNQSDMGQFKIPFPKLETQTKIADYLDNKCEKIDSLIDIKQQKIDKLTEYKKSLIYEYVTGKKEVG